jgi:hypothetical protein
LANVTQISYTNLSSRFQCRERLEWDFYAALGQGADSHPPSSFQCRERLEVDFYKVPESG